MNDFNYNLDCSRHEKKLISICSEEHCESPLLCMSCSQDHNTAHKTRKIDEFFEKSNNCFDPLKDLKQIYNQFSGKNIEKIFVKKVLNTLHYFQRLVNKKINRTVLELKDKLNNLEDQDDKLNFIQDFLGNFSKNINFNAKLKYLNITRSKSFKNMTSIFKNLKVIYDNISLCFENFSSRFSSEFSKIVETNVPDTKSLIEFKDSLSVGINIPSPIQASPFKTNKVLDVIKIDNNLRDISIENKLLNNKRGSSEDLWNILNKKEVLIKQSNQKYKIEGNVSQENKLIISDIPIPLDISQDSIRLDKVVILLPITIPGTGKLNLLNLLLKGCRMLKYNFEMLEGNRILRNLDNSFVFMKPLNSDIDLLDSFGSNKLKLFNSISHILNNQKKGNCLIYIDQNTYPSEIQQIVQVIKHIGCKEKLMRIVAITPDCEFPLKVNDSYYPFSLSYFIQCYIRTKKEASLEDLGEGKFESLVHIAKCFNKFRDFNFKTGSLIDNNQFQYILHLPFTEEIEERDLPIELVNTSKDMLRSLNKRLSKKLDIEIEEYGKKVKFEEKMRSDDTNSKHSVEFLSKIFK